MGAEGLTQADAHRHLHNPGIVDNSIDLVLFHPPAEDTFLTEDDVCGGRTYRHIALKGKKEQERRRT
jgi:hypothetical protein